MNTRIIRVFIRHSIPMLLTLILLGGTAIGITTTTLWREQQRSAEQTLALIQAYYEIILEETDAMNIMFSTNAEIVNRLGDLMNADAWSRQDARDVRSIRSYISAPANARPHIDSIYIYQENSKRRTLASQGGIILLEDMKDKGWYDSFSAQDPEIEIWSEARRIWPTRVIEGDEDVITIYRSIYNKTGRRTGVMVMNLLSRILIEQNPGQQALKGERITILDRQGTELLRIGPSELPTGKKEEKTVRFSRSSARFGWTFRMDVPFSELTSLSRRLSTLTALLALLVLFLGLILTYQTNLKERDFIQRTMELLENARGDRIAAPEAQKGSNLFDYMTENILHSFLEKDYLQMRREAMEYRALQMQINPHFLYNTLETINWRAVKLLDGPNDISRMISLLSRILKYALGGEEESSLADEIRHSSSYLELQRIRFPERFSIDWRIPDDLQNIPIPRLTLQPLLENCLTHALHPDGRRLTITVEAERQGSRLRLCVKDNGIGMESLPEGFRDRDDRDKRDGQNGQEKEESLGSKHIGLINVRRRLKFFFKGDVKMSINSRKDEGTDILLDLPADPERPTLSEHGRPEGSV